MNRPETDALAARDLLERKLAAKISAAQAGILLPPEETDRASLARKARIPPKEPRKQFGRSHSNWIGNQFACIQKKARQLGLEISLSPAA